jgi:predicted permease
LVLSGAYLFFPSFTGAHYATFLAAFATPVAVSSMPMAQEMDADATLAGQLIVWTTLCSAFTLFGFSFVLKAVGIF